MGSCRRVGGGCGSVVGGLSQWPDTGDSISSVLKKREWNEIKCRNFSVEFHKRFFVKKKSEIKFNFNDSKQRNLGLRYTKYM